MDIPASMYEYICNVYTYVFIIVCFGIEILQTDSFYSK